VKRIQIPTDPWQWLKNRTLPLLIALIALIGLHPLLVNEIGEASPAFPLTLAAIPLLGIVTLNGWKRAAPMLVLFATLVLTGTLGYGANSNEIAKSPLELLAFVYYAYSIITIGSTLLKSTALLDDRVYGGLTVYLLTACMFATLHRHVSAVDPNAYWSSVDNKSMILDWDDALYFSMASITTVGFGDLVPRSSWARAVTMIECASGVFVTVVFIARLATAAQGQAQSQSQAPSQSPSQTPARPHTHG
jgi:hypothetical protein